MRVVLIIGASFSCAIGLFMGLVLFGTQDFKNAYGFWSAYILLSFVPLLLLYRSRPDTGRLLQFSVAGMIEICVIWVFLMVMSRCV